MILSGINQLWRADITYIRLRDEFVFLAVILDAYSRRVIGWALDRTMEDSLTLTALRMALSRRAVGPGLVHHSDRGSQYASNDYTDLLKANGIDISMSRKGNPWDNAACESFMKTLKDEEVLRNEYRDIDSAVTSAYEDSQGILWIGTERGLNRVDRRTGQVKRYENVEFAPGVRSIAEDRGGSLWLKFLLAAAL
jgi:transposase InsO family protein